MSKRTVLELTNSALRSIGSDSVTSIDDTPEATDIANMVRDVYFDIIHSRKWPHLRTVIQPTEDVAGRPTHMLLGTDIQDIETETLYYDKRVNSGDPPDYETVCYLFPDEFMALVLGRSDSNDETHVDEISDSAGFKIYVFNDRAPSFYTAFDDGTLIFDAYDSDLESRLQKSKMQVIAYKEPTFTVDDAHTPDLPSKAFPYLLSEIKSVVSLEIAQEANPKQEAISREHRAWGAVNKWRTKGGIRTADFGRK